MRERILNVNREADYGGKHFRSTLEAQTAKALDELGIPYQYEERKIELMEGFKSPFQKDKVRSITYTPDFIIGPIILECKGFETPEWKLKKKLVFKYLQEKEPNIIFHQIHDAKKSLLEMLDLHLEELGYIVQVTPKPIRKRGIETQGEPMLFSSIAEAMGALELIGRPMGTILNSLIGNTVYVFGYSWKLVNKTH